MNITTCWESICSFLRQGQSNSNWHIELADSGTATRLQNEDHNIALLQQTLRVFSATDLPNPRDRQSFRTVLIYLTTQICVVQHDAMLFNYIRAVLEVFILYSIATSDFAWIDDGRSVYLERQTELMYKMTFSKHFQNPIQSGSACIENCLVLAALVETMSRREQCRVEIIKRIVDMMSAMPSLDYPFSTFKHSCHYQRFNSTAFLERIKFTASEWIAMAYCLAIEPFPNEAPPTYIEAPPTYSEVNGVEASRNHIEALSNRTEVPPDYIEARHEAGADQVETLPNYVEASPLHINSCS